MPSWGRGKYGESGGRHIAAAFDRYAAGAFFKSDPDSARGFEARLNYLLKHEGGGEAMASAGLRPKTGQVVDWLTGDVRPNKGTRERVDKAYRSLRGKNIARGLKHKLARDGRGTRVTVEPLPPGKVPPEQRRRQAQFQDRETTIRPRDWNRFVDAWADGDDDALDDAWMDDVAGDLGSPPEAYFEVSHVGFAI